MPRVTVNLESGNGAMINQTVTNNEGDFAFTGLSDNSYMVTASAPDHAPGSERVDFVRSINSTDPGEMRTVEITLVGRVNVTSRSLAVHFVQNVPKEASDSYSLALTSLKEGRPKDGVELLEKAIKAFPDYFDARFALATKAAVSARAVY